MSNNFNHIAKAFNTATRLDRTIRKSDMGETGFGIWQSVSENVIVTAYNVWAVHHDVAGRAVTPDPVALKDANKAYHDACERLVSFIGKIPFADDAEPVFLRNDASFREVFKSFCVGSTTDKSAAMEQVEKDCLESSINLNAARDLYAYYNVPGGNEEGKADAFAKLMAADAAHAANKTRKDEIRKLMDSNVAVPAPNLTTKAFKTMVAVLNGIINEQEAMTYEEYKAEINRRNRAKKEARKAARAAAKVTYAKPANK